MAKTARITTFLPTLAERFTRERLDAHAQADGMQPKRAPEILFVCVHNAGRSQMAAALRPPLRPDTMCTFAPAAPSPASGSNPRSATP